MGRSHSSKSNVSAFTLIELLVGIAIIGVLAVGALVVINPAAQFQKANDAKRKSDLSQIQKALEIFYQDNGKYPAFSSTAPAYRIVKLDGNAVEWGSDWTPYMGNLPADPSSSKKYVYYSSGGQTYYLYASLDRGVNDPQICSGLNGNGECSSVPAADLCGNKCNYGVSTPNVSP